MAEAAAGGKSGKVVIQNIGLLLSGDLDRPILDADTIAWLEDYLRRYSGALLLVTHDRYFLDRVTNKIVELESGQLREFEGNFAYFLERKAESLNLEETLIALCISSTTNPAAQMAMEQLKTLRGCDIHLTHIPAPGDEAGLRRLGVHLTSDPTFATRNLFTA